MECIAASKMHLASEQQQYYQEIILDCISSSSASEQEQVSDRLAFSFALAFCFLSYNPGKVDAAPLLPQETEAPRSDMCNTAIASFWYRYMCDFFSRADLTFSCLSTRMLGVLAFQKLEEGGEINTARGRLTNPFGFCRQ